MRYVRAEDGAILLTRRAVLLATAWAALNGLWSVKAILGKSAGVPSGTPPVSQQTEKRNAAARAYAARPPPDVFRLYQFQPKT
jgi:hypothetical protein